MSPKKEAAVVCEAVKYIETSGRIIIFIDNTDERS